MISCVLNVYNDEQHISKAISSVIEQVEEVIVVNDCTPDNSMQKIPKHPKIKIINNKENKGLGWSRNKGLKQVNPKTEYILFLDGDIELKQDYIQKCIKYMKTRSNPEEQIVGCIGVRKTPQKTNAQKFMNIMRTRQKKEFYLVDGALIIKYKWLINTFPNLQPFYQHVKRGGTPKIFKKVNHKGTIFRIGQTKITSCIHHGEPLTWSQLLQRQFKYGSEQKNFEKVNLMSIIRALICITPITMLIGIEIILKEKADLKTKLWFPFDFMIFIMMFHIAYIGSLK